MLLWHRIPALPAGLHPVTFRPREWQEQHLPFLSFISAIFSASNTLQYPPVPWTTSSPPNSLPHSMASSCSWEPTTPLEDRFPTPILDTRSLKTSFVFCFVLIDFDYVRAVLSSQRRYRLLRLVFTNKTRTKGMEGTSLSPQAPPVHPSMLLPLAACGGGHDQATQGATC